MPVTPTNAVNAYLSTLRNAGSGGMEPRAQGDDFAALLEGAAKNMVDATRASEATAQRALGGKADVNEVVTAVTNAEVALQTVVAVRDRVIQAYQEIMRMPI